MGSTLGKKRVARPEPDEADRLTVQLVGFGKEASLGDVHGAHVDVIRRYAIQARVLE